MTEPVRIPADIDLPDRVLGPFTARQLAVLTATAALLYLAGAALRGVAPLPVALGVALPVLGCAGLLVFVQRDGLTLDRLLWAALRHHAAGTRRIAAPDGVPLAPAWLTAAATVESRRETPPWTQAQPWPGPVRSVTPTRPGPTATIPAAVPEAMARAGGRDPDRWADRFGGRLGVLDLGGEGLCVIAAASTVNFGLRTPAEQDALVTGFGRYLHSLTAPVQILVRAERLDLTGQSRDLRARAATLPDPGLERLALDHAEFLDQLGARADLLRRQVLLIWRDPTATPRPDGDRNTGTEGDRSASDHLSRRAPRSARRRRAVAGVQARRAAEDRLARRVTDAAELLAPIGITVTGLDAARAAAVLTAATNPGLPIAPSPTAALPGDTITAATAPTTAPTTMPTTGPTTAWTGLARGVTDPVLRGEARRVPVRATPPARSGAEDRRPVGPGRRLDDEAIEHANLAADPGLDPGADLGGPALRSAPPARPGPGPWVGRAPAAVDGGFGGPAERTDTDSTGGGWR